ncbi:sensor histidine kinase [Mucilaginibacter sp. OK098]|uniref:sensor histidine kinase n=1 Tax=Mucilaginibacter sp. OK098 TaxID=1855297 RepID=UPI0009107907|nr:histidine kinase [Mucilaginibacter sp. OK098]SHN25037.1 Histidine kinase [Mucilaginibacter sp. OK098]
MKKISLLLLLLIALAKPTKAQFNYSLYSQSYPNGTTDKASNLGIITAVYETNDSFWIMNPGDGLFTSLSHSAAFQKGRPHNFTAITTFDTAKAQFLLHGVNKTNAPEYEFRVTDGDNKVIEPWGAITKFTDYSVGAVSGMPQMAYLGGYRTSIGNKVIIDVRKKGSDKIVATSVVAWPAIKPVVGEIYTANELDLFFKRLSRPWSYRATDEEIGRWKKHYTVDQLDPQTLRPKKLILEPTDNNLIFYLLADIYNRKQVEYQLEKNGEVFIPWKVNDFDNQFVWLKNLTPGQYLLKMRYNVQRQNVTSYPFEVKTPWYQSTLFKIIAGILICAFMGFILFLIMHIKQKQKADRELAKKTKLQLELKSIYAQLNPHFIFNALSSIQGLINKQDIKGANIYLSDFAKLMRESLNNSNKDQTSLDKEILTLETYLKLEQLRFGFKYEIHIDKEINIYETEIPSLLLQPMVENAVKHGVSALQEKGLVSIGFAKQQNNMAVTIKDNGEGFLANVNSKGFGLKLTQDRIKLLNEFTKDQPVTFEVKKNVPTGAKIELTFKNWFL